MEPPRRPCILFLKASQAFRSYKSWLSPWLAPKAKSHTVNMEEGGTLESNRPSNKCCAVSSPALKKGHTFLS